jgi:hypothetical protein
VRQEKEQPFIQAAASKAEANGYPPQATDLSLSATFWREEDMSYLFVKGKEQP